MKCSNFLQSSSRQYFFIVLQGFIKFGARLVNFRWSEEIGASSSTPYVSSY
jgi:hypothetical protein